MSDRETETEGPPLSKWRRLKESLFQRKAEPSAEELTPEPEPPPAALEIEPGPAAAETEPTEDTPAAALFSSLLPDSPAPMEKGNREKKGRSRSETRQRVKGVFLRLTAAEYDALQERSRNSGLSVGAYLRACGLGDKGPRARRAPPIQGDLLAHAIAALNRVGNNVNQIAHNLNAGGHPDSKQIAEAKAELSECFKALLKALGRKAK